MRPCRRITAGTAALLMLLGFFCPAICFADDSTPSDQSPQSVQVSPSCHDSKPAVPADDGSEPRSEHSDCTHCDSAASFVFAAADWSGDFPDLGIARPWRAPTWRLLTFVGRISARSHDPPPRDLLLVKNSFLL